MSSTHPASLVKSSADLNIHLSKSVYPSWRLRVERQDQGKAIKKLAWTFSVSLVAALISQTSLGLAQQPQPSRRPPISTRIEDAPATEQDNLRMLATNLNAMRSRYFAKGDATSIANMYTHNAVYTELMPRLSMMNGRKQIENHFRELFAAHATELNSTVTRAEMVDADTQIVGGDYSLVAGGKRTAGHFVQTLKREDGEWRIAVHIFARPEPVTFQELNEYRG